ETTGYTSLGQVQSQTYSVGSGSAAAGVGSTYWGTSDLTANSSPGSLKSEQINLPDGTSNALTSFNYDQYTKRLQTIAVNGTAVQFSYLDNGQVGAVNVGPADNSGNLVSNGQV